MGGWDPEDGTYRRAGFDPSTGASMIEAGMEALDLIQSYTAQACASNIAVYMTQLALGADPDDQKYVLGSNDPNPRQFVTSYNVNGYSSVSIPSLADDPKGFWRSFTFAIAPAGDPNDIAQAFSVTVDPIDVTLPGLGEYTMNTYKGNRGDAEGQIVGMGTRLNSTKSGESFKFTMEPNPRDQGNYGRLIGSNWQFNAASVSSGGAVVLGGMAGGALIADAGNFPLNNMAAVVAQTSSRSQGIQQVVLNSVDGGLVLTNGVYHSDRMVPIGGAQGTEKVFCRIDDELNIPAGTAGAVNLNGGGTVAYAFDGSLTTKGGSTGGPHLSIKPAPNVPPTRQPSVLVTVEAPAWNIPKTGLAAYGNSFPLAASSPGDFWTNPPSSGGALDFTAGGVANSGIQPMLAWPQVDPAPGPVTTWNNYTSSTTFVDPVPAMMLNPWNPATQWPTPIIGIPVAAEPAAIGSCIVSWVHSQVDRGVNVTTVTTKDIAIYASRGTGSANATTLVPAFWLGRLQGTAALTGQVPPSTVGAYPMAGANFVHTAVQGYVEMAEQQIEVVCPAEVTGRVNLVSVTVQVAPPGVKSSVGPFFMGTSSVGQFSYNPQAYTSGIFSGLNNIITRPMGTSNTAVQGDGTSCLEISNYLKMDKNQVLVAPGLPANGDFPAYTAGRWAVPGSLSCTSGGIFGPGITTTGVIQVAPTIVPIWTPASLPLYREDVALPADGEYVQGIHDGRPGHALFFTTLEGARSGGEFGWGLPNQTQRSGRVNVAAAGSRAFYPNEGPIVASCTQVIRETRGQMGVIDQPSASLTGLPGVQKYSQMTVTNAVNSWSGFVFHPGQPICEPVVVSADGSTLLPGSTTKRAVDIAQPLFVDLPAACKLVSIQFYYLIPTGSTQALQVICFEDIARETNFVASMRAKLEVVEAGQKSVAQLDYVSNVPKISQATVETIRTLFQICQFPTFMSHKTYAHYANVIQNEGDIGIVRLLRETFDRDPGSNTGNAAFGFGKAFTSLRSMIENNYPVVKRFVQENYPAVRGALAPVGRVGMDVLRRLADDPEVRDYAARRVGEKMGGVRGRLGEGGRMIFDKTMPMGLEAVGDEAGRLLRAHRGEGSAGFFGNIGSFVGSIAPQVGNLADSVVARRMGGRSAGADGGCERVGMPTPYATYRGPRNSRVQM